MLRTIIYIDGFNLYYGCLKDTPYRWLDPLALCRNVLNADNDVVAIKYFTAKVKSRDTNPNQAQRQQIYLRALDTIPCLETHFGHFISREANRRLADPPAVGSKFARVIVTEEKGSDVNLASHLLVDGFRARYDMAVVISNDSDLMEPVRFVREELNAPVGILNPHSNRSWGLSPKKLPRGSFYKPIRAGALAASQFAPELSDAAGNFHRPPDWS